MFWSLSYTFFLLPKCWSNIWRYGCVDPNSGLSKSLAPTSYKWGYSSYKWPYKWVTGVIKLIGVITPFITATNGLVGIEWFKGVQMCLGGLNFETLPNVFVDPQTPFVSTLAKPPTKIHRPAIRFHRTSGATYTCESEACQILLHLLGFSVL